MNGLRFAEYKTYNEAEIRRYIVVLAGVIIPIIRQC